MPILIHYSGPNSEDSLKIYEPWKNGEQSGVKQNINQWPSTIKNMLTSLVLYETAGIAQKHWKLIEESMVETNFHHLNGWFLNFECIRFLEKFID